MSDVCCAGTGAVLGCPLTVAMTCYPWHGCLMTLLYSHSPFPQTFHEPANVVPLGHASEQVQCCGNLFQRVDNVDDLLDIVLVQDLQDTMAKVCFLVYLSLGVWVRWTTIVLLHAITETELYPHHHHFSSTPP